MDTVGEFSASLRKLPQTPFLRQFAHDIKTALLSDCRLRKFQMLVCVAISACVFTLSMSPELETLDQLLGSDLLLGVVQRLYPDATAFKRGVLGLITCGDVCLFTTDEIEVPAGAVQNFL
jgi:hypothetical protein